MNERIGLRRRFAWWWYCVTFRFHRHQYCEPGCSTTAHCWRCYATMPQTAEWDSYWIDDDGIAYSKADIKTDGTGLSAATKQAVKKEED